MIRRWVIIPRCLQITYDPKGHWVDGANGWKHQEIISYNKSTLENAVVYALVFFNLRIMYAKK